MIASLTYRPPHRFPGALAPARALRMKLARLREMARERWHIGVWEAEGGSLEPA